MAHILLHKQALSKKQIEGLEACGVIAIRTDHPKDFKFLDAEVSKIEVNEMVWAALDACAADESMYRVVGMRLVNNLAQIAAEKIKKLETSKPSVGTA